MRHFGFARLPGQSRPSARTASKSIPQDKGLTGAEIPVSLLFADVRGLHGNRRRACGQQSFDASSIGSTGSGPR